MTKDPLSRLNRVHENSEDEQDVISIFDDEIFPENPDFTDVKDTAVTSEDSSQLGEEVHLYHKRSNRMRNLVLRI